MAAATTAATSHACVVATCRWMIARHLVCDTLNQRQASQGYIAMAAASPSTIDGLR